MLLRQNIGGERSVRYGTVCGVHAVDHTNVMFPAAGDVCENGRIGVASMQVPNTLPE